MPLRGHKPHLFNWKGFTKSETPAKKVQTKNDDIHHWMKRVEKASEFAVSEAFSHNKCNSVMNSKAKALKSTDGSEDYDTAYSEAQDLLSEWMGSKLRQELGVGEEDDPIGSSEKGSPVPLGTARPFAMDYSNFNDLYDHLAVDEEDREVSGFLNELMQREVDYEMVEDLALDFEPKETQARNPRISMEARQRQVRENRERREAERAWQQREKAAQRAAKEEAVQRERRQEMRQRQEARRQEEMVQKEMVKLRCQMQEQRDLEQLVIQRERARLKKEKGSETSESCPPPAVKQQHQDTNPRLKQQQIQAKVLIHHLKCQQRHFSGWYSLLLEQRIRMGKAAALCDWRRKLRAWRAWHTLVWTERKQRERERTEEELRAENRRCQLAVESDRRRLLRQCLNSWQRWCRKERDQRELLTQQEETRRRMAALISAASTGKLQVGETVAPGRSPATQRAAEGVRGRRRNPNNMSKETQDGDVRSGVPAASSAPRGNAAVGSARPARPRQPWKVNRGHVALSTREQREGEGDGGGGGGALPGSCFEHRHTAQQQTIFQQRKLLREQQEQISRLEEERRKIGLQLAQQLIQPPTKEPKQQSSSSKSPTRESDGQCATPKNEVISRQPPPNPIVSAMELRAQQRLKRRKEIEELRKQKEEEKRAHIKAADEQKQLEEEAEKRRVVERKREQKRKEKEWEAQKQEQLKRERELQVVARQHYQRSLLLWRGLAPWKRLLRLRQTHMQLAESHHGSSLQRRSIRAWKHSVADSLSEKQAMAGQLHQHFLLRRGLNAFKTLKKQRNVLDERAQGFHRSRTLGRVLQALVNHMTRQRLREWDQQEQAQNHRNRCVLQCCFLAWRRFPCLHRQEKAREARRDQLRKKVAEVLPDFRPVVPQSL